MNKLQLILLSILLSIFLGSCRTLTPQYDYQELARASIRLGMDIDLKVKEEQIVQD